MIIKKKLTVSLIIVLSICLFFAFGFQIDVSGGISKTRGTADVSIIEPLRVAAEDAQAAVDEAQLALDEANTALAIVELILGDSTVLEAALKEDTNDKVTLVTLANSYLDSGSYSRATDIYERLTYLEPVEDEAFYDLGFSYGKSGKYGLAHYNFGLFYKKTYNNYLKVLELVQSGGEPSEAAGNMGPDTDKNWGYDGILYIATVLTVKIGSKEPDLKKRIENFERSKRYLSRLFGIGKTSKSRPSELLDMTRDLYEKINELLEEWNQEIGSAEESP